MLSEKINLKKNKLTVLLIEYFSRNIQLYSYSTDYNNLIIEYLIYIKLINFINKLIKNTNNLQVRVVT